MKHPQPSTGKHTVNDMEILTSQVSSQEFIHVIEPALTADFQWSPSDHFIEVFRGVSMMKS
jgi:hypothetical protein